jgi:hypothetical protein
MKYKGYSILIVSLISLFGLYSLFSFIKSNYNEYKFNSRTQFIEKQLDISNENFELITSFTGGCYSDDCELIDSWHGEFKHSSLPENIVFSVNLEIIDDYVYPIDSLFQKSDYIINQIKKVDILIEYVKKNPESRLKIRFVNDRSLSQSACNNLYNELGAEYYNDTHNSFYLRGEKINFDTTKLKLGVNNYDTTFNWVSSKLDSAIYCHLINLDSYFTWIILPDNHLLLRKSSCMKIEKQFFSTNSDIDFNKDPIIIFDYKGNRIFKNKNEP